MKKILWLILLFILNTFVSGQNEKVQIFLKNGSSKCFSVKEVKSWCLLNSKGFGASFTVIDSITTSNNLLADSIIFQFEEAGYKKINNEYVIDISNSKRKYLNIPEKLKFGPKSVSVYYSLNKIEEVVYKMEYYSGLMDRLCFKMEGSLGFNSNKMVPFNQNFGFGIIYISKLHNEEIGIGFSITNFNNYAKNSGKFNSLWIESLDFSFGIPIIEGKYFIRFETNLYLEKLDVFDYNSIVTVRFGVGRSL